MGTGGALEQNAPTCSMRDKRDPGELGLVVAHGAVSAWVGAMVWRRTSDRAVCNLLDAGAKVVTRIALALFGDEVSPRFCFAQAVVVVELARGQVVRREVVSLGEPFLSRRIAQLAALGVEALLCGAFNRAYLPAAESLGIRVITGMSGNAEEALARFIRGGGCSRRRGKGCDPG
jgi:predicted Fe-Mo cluster-binding NifX family protein